MRLAIADPPYPAFVLGAGGRKPRASRWYGAGQLSLKDTPADYHPDAKLWDDPAMHVALMERLMDEYDGWAIATSWDGIYTYGTPPRGTRIMVWHRPNSAPGSHRVANRWEAVLLHPPKGRRSNREVGSTVDDVLTASVPAKGFVGSKPPEWAYWVLDALTYDPEQDVVDDLFGGSGAVTEAIRRYRPDLRGDPARQARAMVARAVVPQPWAQDALFGVGGKRL